MASSDWQKTNHKTLTEMQAPEEMQVQASDSKIFRYVWAITFGFFAFLLVREQSSEFLSFTIAFITGLVLLGLFISPKAQVQVTDTSYTTMRRPLKMDFTIVDDALWEMIKYKRISASHTVDEVAKITRYEFAGHELTLDVSPYNLLDRRILSQGSSTKLHSSEVVGTLIEFNGINTKNRGLAEKLAEMIDEVVVELKSPASSE